MERRKHKVVFDHVPKTGGQAITVALSQALGEDGRMSNFSNAHAQALKQMSSRRFVAGHFWFRPGEALSPDCYYCTVLRDPVDRFLSQYFFNREIAKQLREELPQDLRLADAQVIAAERLDLAAYLSATDIEVVQSYTNVQAMHFAQRICANPWNLSPDALLESAIRGLESYDLVGTYSELQSFADEICMKFNAEPVALLLVNKTSSRQHASDIPADVRARLEAANQVDMQLLAWAKRRFASRHEPTATMASAEPLPADTAAGGVADFGTREIELLAAHYAGPYSDPAEIHPGDHVRLVLECEARIAEPDLTIGIGICDESGEAILGTNTKLIPQAGPVSVKGRFSACFHFRAVLAPGTYSVSVALHKGLAHTAGCYHWKDAALQFSVKEPRPFEPHWLAEFKLLDGGQIGDT